MNQQNLPMPTQKPGDARRKKLFYRFARLGLDAEEKDGPSGPAFPDRSVSALRVRGIVAAARLRSGASTRLTAEIGRELEDALAALSSAHDARVAGYPIDVRVALAETRKTAESLAGAVRRFGASSPRAEIALVSLGSSPEKAAYVLEAACGAKRSESERSKAGCPSAVQYVPVSREWTAGKRKWGPKKKAEFDALFAEPLAFASVSAPVSVSGPEPRPRLLVFVDYAATFKTMLAVEAMLLKWHPTVHAASRFVALVDRQSDAVHTHALGGRPAWATIPIPQVVWDLAKAFRCVPRVDKSGALVPLDGLARDACEAVRLLLEPEGSGRRAQGFPRRRSSAAEPGAVSS